MLTNSSRANHALSTLEFAKESVDNWRQTNSYHGFPYIEIALAVREYGKHFVSTEFLDKLDILRRDLAVSSRSDSVLNFLNIVLDKYDSNYDYRSYLALENLGLPDTKTTLVDYSDSLQRIDRMLVLLVSDVIKFEHKALSGNTWMSTMLPDKDLVDKRTVYAMKILSPYLSRTSLRELGRTGKEMCFPSLVREVDLMTSGEERHTLNITMLPVHTVHDEYMFIRVLQCFEYVFSWIAVYLRAAISAFSHDPKVVALHINNSTSCLKEALYLFRLLRTMRSDSFKEFREFTEGASAIQSRNYKLIESLCCHPEQGRVDSIAYDSVPDVQEQLAPDMVTIDSEYARVIEENIYPPGEIEEVESAMKEFGIILKRWREAHYGIARIMLGDGAGTGYTEGTPYLKKVKSIPVFSSLEKIH